MDTDPIPATCRLCESACGLLASRAADGLRLVPDRDHPVSLGYACAKGLNFPARLRGAERREVAEWQGQAVGPEAGLRAAGERLRAIRQAHGGDSIGIYLGNAAGQSFGALLGAEVLRAGLGARSWSCLTLDNSAQVAVNERIFGSALQSFRADYAQSDCIALFGTDPLESQPSQMQSNPDGVRELLRSRERLIVVDPRRSRTARAAALHLQVRPGSDAILLGALCREVIAVIRRGRSRPEQIAEAELHGLERALEEAGLTMERAARAAGLDQAVLERLRDRLLSAERPLCWSGLGVLLGPEGGIGWWLTVCLQGLLGGIGQPGGWIAQRGAVDVAGWSRRLGLKGADPLRRSAISGLPSILGGLPAAEIPEEIRRGALKALIVVGGNPARSIPGADRTVWERLGLLICLDPFRSETSALAHAVFPSAAWPERWNTDLHLCNQRAAPELSLQPPVIAPPGDARPDEDWLLALAQIAGSPAVGAAAWLLARVGWPRIGRVLTRLLPGAHGQAIRQTGRTLLPGRPAALPARLPLHQPDWAARLKLLADPPAGLLLISSERPLNGLNTWIRGADAPARMNPASLARCAADGHLTVETPGGPVRVPVVPDPDLPQDVVAWPFGSGAPNTILPAGPLDAIGAQPVMNGHRLTLL